MVVETVIEEARAGVVAVGAGDGPSEVAASCIADVVVTDADVVADIELNALDEFSIVDEAEGDACNDDATALSSLWDILHLDQF